jgi:hypothetical protein
MIMIVIVIIMIVIEGYAGMPHLPYVDIPPKNASARIY